MTPDTAPGIRRLLPAAYVVAILFIITPLIDVVTNVWPMEPGNIQWRFGFFGVASNYLVSGLFGVLLLALAAAWAAQRGVMMVAIILAAFGGLLLLGLALLYGLDVLQLRSNVRPEAEFPFKVGAMKSFFKMVTTGLALLMIAVGTWKARKE